jgi:beta-glucosidase
VSSHLERLLDDMTLDERVSLLAGANFWHTAGIPRLGVAPMRVSDGPVGARGVHFDGPASINVPCSTLLGATWDVELVEQIGALLGRETKAKGASVLLAPTVNLHRTPIGGRNFECVSEDPLLTAQVAVAYVTGLQSEGVASCIKHFVGNDTEFERMSIDSVIDERTLRELYLVPFEAAVRDAGVMAVMTSYNRINGDWAAESPLVADVLRGEWGFDGLVMSDWFGTHSTVAALHAGLDLEMPGPTLHRGALVIDALERGEISEADVRERALVVLAFLDRLGVLGTDGPGPETTRHDDADESLVRRAAAAGMVLLQNRGPVDAAPPTLPLQPAALRRIAVIGPNSSVGQIMGGGSAHVTPTQISHPLAALRSRLEPLGIEVSYAPGCTTFKRLPELDAERCSELSVDLFATPDELDDSAAVPLSTITAGTSRLMWPLDPTGRGDGNPAFGARMSTVFTPDVTGAWRFSVESITPARVLVDGVVLLDNTDVPPGGSFFGMGRGEVVASLELEAGRPVRLSAELRHHRTGAGMSGLNIGAAPPVRGDMIDEAERVAAEADLAVIVVGTNDDWESEGWDRTTLDLPGEQDELVRRVAAVSAATVVVVNAGSPVAMPWLDEVESVLMAWFPGQAMGDAMVDVLLGDVEPQGRLPVSFPARLEDTPAFEHHPGRNGSAQYLEGRLMGYRWYDTVGRRPLFPFGFGLGYASTVITSARADDPFSIEAVVTNASDRDAVEVVQVYAHRVDRSGLPADEADQILVGFAKVAVPAGGSATATVTLRAEAYRSWDLVTHRWVVPGGEYELRVGRSSRDIDVTVPVMVPAMALPA